MVEVSLVFLGPLFVEKSAFEHVDVFACHFVVAARDRSFGHVFQVFRPPSESHTVFHAPTIAIVFLSVMVIQGFTAYVGQPYEERRVGACASFPVLEHFVTGPSEAEQSQVLVHDHQAGWLCRPAQENGRNLFPVFFLYGTCHQQFLAEILIHIPRLFQSPCSGRPYEQVSQKDEGIFLDGRHVIIEDGTRQWQEKQYIIRCTIVCEYFSACIETRQGSRVDFADGCLAIKMPCRKGDSDEQQQSPYRRDDAVLI